MEFLEELRGEGTVDSVGRFTIDPERALELLSQFRFESPFEYVLKLVQAGVAGGARRVSLRVSRRETAVELEGWAPPEDFLQDPLRRALETGGDVASGHLAVGLLAARALRPRELDASKTQEGFRVVLRDPQRPSRAYSGPEWLRWGESVNHLPGDLIAEIACLRDSELTQAWRRCVFAPIPVLVNGRLANKPFFGGRVTTDREKLTVVPRDTGWAYRRLIHVVGAERGVAGARAIPWRTARREVPHLWDLVHFFGSAPDCRWIAPPGFPEDAAAEPLPLEDHKHEVEFDVTKLRLRGVPPHVGPNLDLLLWEVPALACHAVLGEIGQDRGWLALVRDGVVLRKSAPPEGLHGWRVIADASSLDLTLSQMDVVEDERFERLLDRLVQVAQGGGTGMSHPPA